MFNLIKRWYDGGVWNDALVQSAAARGWITTEEAQDIVGI